MTMKLLFAMAFVLMCAACTTIGKARPADAVFLQVAKSPEAFDRKSVTVKAWITLRHEDKNLWATWRDHENWDTTNCLSLVNYDSLDDEMDGKYVEVTGMVIADASNDGAIIRLASCRGAAIEVSGPSAIRPVEK